METKPKVGGSPRKAKPKKKLKPQCERFIEVARERGVTEEGFERLFKAVVLTKKPR
jgi:hypothetical protein